MDILGVGGMELAMIVIIMLVVAGPKRMLTWAYIAGTYVSKLREMWKTVSADLQKEIDAAGLDVTLPKDLPNRQNINGMVRQQFNRVAAPVTGPIAETFEQARTLPTRPAPRERVAEPVSAAPQPLQQTEAAP